MNTTDLKGKKITVMGLGLHGGGVGTARFLAEAGAKVIVTDMKSKEELAASVLKLRGIKNITFVFNQHRPEDFTKTDMVIKTPGAPWNNKYVKMALDNKVSVEVDSSLFFKLCKNPIIGVTGTKGKTTTASLICEILKTAGKNPVRVGIGQTSVLDKLKMLKKESIVVFELSSWRLSALGRAKISPKYAVVTNIYPDHLNYYKSMKEYIADKINICRYQKANDVCVINGDDDEGDDFKKEAKSQVVLFSKNKIESGKAVYLSDDTIYCNNGIDEKKLMNMAEIKMKGNHNIGNILAAVAVARELGIKLIDIKKAIANFSGVAHRLELVRELNGVKYYNDTAATTPESAIAGLKSFSEKIILICGGADKNLNMEEFAQVILEKANGVVFLKGRGTEKIIAAIKKNNCEVSEKKFPIVESMEKAVELASREAEKGDVVLLSPGASSFGLFVNEFDRGDKFKEAVKKLK